MGFALFFLIPLVCFGLPLVVLTDKIGRRAETRGVNASPYLWIAVLGSFFGWLAACVVAVGLSAGRISDDYARYGLFLALGTAGATLVPFLCYTRLCMRTLRDPDYQELTASPRSHVAHIPQPRDGDDVLPE